MLLVSYRNCEPWENPIALKPFLSLVSEERRSHAFLI